MTSEQLSGWITIAQVLVAVGVDIGTRLKNLIHAAHPDMTDEEADAAFDAIIADDQVRAAIALAASKPATE